MFYESIAHIRTEWKFAHTKTTVLFWYVQHFKVIWMIQRKYKQAYINQIWHSIKILEMGTWSFKDEIIQFNWALRRFLVSAVKHHLAPLLQGDMSSPQHSLYQTPHHPYNSILVQIYFSNFHPFWLDLWTEFYQHHQIFIALFMVSSCTLLPSGEPIPTPHSPRGPPIHIRRGKVS